MARRKSKKSNKLVKEMQKQLISEAERWGQTSYYTPMKLEEIALEQAQKIHGELLTEKANLEYEMNMLGSNKQDVLVKIQRLDVYIKRAEKRIADHERTINKIIENSYGGKETARRVKSVTEKKPRISVMIGG